MWLAEPNKTHDTAHHAPNAEISPAKSATMRTFLGAMSKPFLGFFYAHHFASRHDEPGSLIPAGITCPFFKTSLLEHRSTCRNHTAFSVSP